MKYQLSDEDGIIAIVNAEKYNGFIGEDWELNELTELFVQQMNEQNLIIWKASEYGNNWNIEIRVTASHNKAFRTFEKTIEVTSGELYFIDYTSLTMIAQFENESVKGQCPDIQKINIENGSYNVTVRQMSDPDNFEEEDNKVHFEIILKKSTKHDSVNQIFWWETN
ncbi:MAG: hypothetical protein LBU84_01160 [Prevotella sp.]|jgi:hypothetical protein|nr:hypothetical protein [Prevotella sp.]